MQQSYDREKIEIFLSARKLANKDNFSESDPRVKIYYRESNGQETLICKTETQKNNLNPNWKTTFQIDYIFEVNQYLRFDVIDEDDSAMDKDDLIGSAIVSVGEIMGSKNQVFSAQLKNKHKANAQGTLLIKADRVQMNNNTFVFWQWKGEKLLNTDGFFGKSDPFLRFFKKGGDSWLQVYETEFVKDTLDPLWRPFEIQVARLNNGEHHQRFKIECWDNSKSGKHNFIGEAETSLAELFDERKSDLHLVNKKEKKPGVLVVQQKAIIKKPTFIEYLQGGEQINMIIAIDFTGSNGDPKSPHSLHAITQGQFNQYQTALSQVSQILLNYDFDKRVPLYGFGGVPKFPNFSRNSVEHCFPLTGDFSQPEVFGLQGIMDYYAGALQYVSLSGPTYFSPVIEYAKQIAATNKNKDIYTVLLILTDGEIHDMDKTSHLIMECIALPISIIIIGVGNENFQQMRNLDGDDGPLKKQKGGNVYRDLVQFVAFKDHAQNVASLSREVLAELPKQLVMYKQIVGQPPKQHVDMSLSKMG